uniref:DUF4218 domain-containing protein n=1 Tax=Tanacetum cinerariifolium TaxID=118510 RepID=A0A6L2JN31_TANCI|nr:hypothetical protein [Tanacetum cinerariifolium]
MKTDQEWMYNIGFVILEGRKEYNPAFIDRVVSFVEFACQQPTTDRDNDLLRCPCSSYKNRAYKSTDDIKPSDPKTKRLYELLHQADEPLWPGCTKVLQSSLVSRMLNIKSESRMTEKIYDDVMQVLKDALPPDNKLVGSFYETKKFASYLDLPYPYMFLTIIVPGPKNPKQRIDVFLQPLIKELTTLWKGVPTYDISKERNFTMRAALLWTINDFLDDGMLSGWSTAGKKACPYCMENSKAFSLSNGKKVSWFDCHRYAVSTDARMISSCVKCYSLYIIPKRQLYASLSSLEVIEAELYTISESRGRAPIMKSHPGMARRRKRLGAKESRPGESRPTGSGPTESKPRVGEGQSNDIPNNATINDNTDETTTENTTENLNNPSNGRKQVQVVNGLLDKSSECSREITKISKERIDDTWYTWTKVSQPTKNFYFGEFKDNVLRLRQEREGNQASTGSQVDETALYIEAASGAKERNLYDCDSDSENTDGGDAHQGPNTSNSRAGESNSQEGERKEDDHDSRMIAILPVQYPRVYLWVFCGELGNPTNNLPMNAKHSPTQNGVGKLTHDRGSKRRREGKEPESTSAPKEKATKTTCKSTEWSKSHQKTTSDSAPAEEPMQTTQDLEEPSHQEFETCVADDQPIAEASQHPKCDLAKQADSRSSFNELMDTPVDCSAFLMNRIKVDTLTPELLAGPTYELMKGDDDKLYKFKEGDFKRLHIQEIKDMLLLLLQGKLTNLTVEERFAFNVSLRMFTRSIVIQRRVEDLQLGVESYQKKLNLTNPDMYRFDLSLNEAYTAYSNPRGFIYQNKDKQNRLIQIDKLHKFSDGTLNDVRTDLDDRLKGIWMKYLPQAIWRRSDKERATVMIQAIDKQLKTRRIMRSLEKFVGGRLYEGDFRMLQRTIRPEPERSTQGYPLVSVKVLRYDKRSKGENMGIVPTEMKLILEQTQQGISHEVSQYLPVNVAKPIIELCLFFKQICSQTLMEDDMLKAQSKVVDIMCNLELIYPPGFFDIMIHFVIHLPLEALKDGPIRP